MRWIQPGLIVGLACVLTSARMIAQSNNSLLARAEPVTRISPDDRYTWKNQQVVTIRRYLDTEEETVEVDRRTHERMVNRRFNLFRFDGGVFDRPETKPNWLPPGAKIVNFQRVPIIAFLLPKAERPKTEQEAWVVAWPESGTAPPTAHPRFGQPQPPEARYGVWITGTGGTHPHLLGVAPLSRQEYEALTRDYNYLFLPAYKEVSFVYRGMLYVMPVSGKIAPL